MAEDAPDAGIAAEDQQRPQSPEADSEGIKEEETGEQERGPIPQDERAISEQPGENHQEEEETEPPPLPDEDAPPLPNEPLPEQEDDGWDALWDDSSRAFYFYNRFSGVSQWENPRVPMTNDNTERKAPSRAAGGYDPTIHGDYDPTAWYAQQNQQPDDNATAAAPTSSTDPNMIYTATGTFNRFTGTWQPAGLTPDQFNDENKSRRQMNAYFDVDAAANNHDGKSLKAERSGKKLTKKELKAFREKRKERKEEKRKAWLRD